MIWQNIKLGDLFEQYRIEHIVQDNIEYGQITISKNGYIKFRTKKKGNTIGRKRQFVIDLKKYPNTMLFTRQGVSEGAIGFAPKEVNGCIATENMPMFSLKPNIPKKFVELLFKSQQYIEKVQKIIPTGSAQKSIHERDLLLIELTIPDEKGQLQLVEQFNKIEDDISILDNEVEYQQNLLTKLKQSILQEAIEGKLTANWREQNLDIEPASILLEKILAEKEQLIKEKKLKKPQPIKNIKTLRDTNIPTNWKWAKGDELFFTTKLAGFEYTEHITLKDIGEVPVIRAQNVRPFNIKKDNLKYIDMDTSLKLHRCALTKPALLVTFIGAGIGDVALFNEEKRWHLAPNVAKQEVFEGCEDLISLKFINHYMMSNIGKKELFKHVKATAQPSLSMGTIRDIDYPIPPIEEQKEIVNKIEKLFAICDELEEQINSSKQNTQSLMQAVLKEAFER